MSQWRFDDPENTMVFTTRQVLEDGGPVLWVSHDADDGSWQFHTAGDARVDDARILALREMVEIDPTVGELWDLPRGWVAVRASIGSPWKRRETDEASDERAG